MDFPAYHPIARSELRKARRRLTIPLELFLLRHLIAPSVFAACGNDEVDTAIGCIPTKTGEFASWVVGKAVIVATLCTILLTIIGGLRIITSTGNPEAINAGRAMITAAISGLAFILMSVLILRIIGVEILGIPGWIY